jgi:hypothetical protein
VLARLNNEGIQFSIFDATRDRRKLQSHPITPRGEEQMKTMISSP